MAETRDGGCMCGRTRFTFAGPPKFVGNCHCAQCRRWTGAAMTTYVGGRDDQTTWNAPPAVYHSSPGVDRFYCPACGTPLAYRGHKWPGETHLLIGAFDDPTPFVPTSDVFVEEGLAWARPGER